MARLRLPEAEREVSTAIYPDYNEEMNQSYDAYIESCIENMDNVMSTRTSDMVPNTAIDISIDTDGEEDKDGLIAYNPNSHENEELSNKFTHQNPEAKSSSYYEALRKEAQEAADRSYHAMQVRTGQALNNFTAAFGGVDKMNMSMDQVLNAIAQSNTNQKLFNAGMNKNANGFTVKDGRYVRQFSPNFTACPKGNPYAQAFAYWSKFPMTPQYAEVKQLFAEEEMKAVEQLKRFYILCGTPDGMTDEEWEREVDRRYNPYTQYGVEVPKPQQQKEEDDFVLESHFKFKFKLKITDSDGKETVYNKHVDDHCVYDGLWLQQDIAHKEKIDQVFRDAVAFAPGNLYRQFLIRQQEEYDRKCPGWDTMTAKEFYNNREFAANYVRKTWKEPMIRDMLYKQKYQERFGKPNVLPMEDYLKNLGIQRIRDIESGKTEGDLMIQKLNLQPGTPGYDAAIQKKNDEIRWCQEHLNPDGSYNIEKIKEKYPNWDAMKKAHRLSIMYTDRKKTIGDHGSILNLPFEVEQSLTVEEKQACGILPEAPDYEAMRTYAESKGKTIVEAFDLSQSPFAGRFEADGMTLKPGGFGQPGFEPKTCKYKTIDDCPDYFEHKEDIPEQFRNDFMWSKQDKRWLNLSRI